MRSVVDNAALGRGILCVLLFSLCQSYPTHARYSLFYHAVDGQYVRGCSSTHSLVHHDYNKNLERNVSFPPDQTHLSNSSYRNQETNILFTEFRWREIFRTGPDEPEARLDSCTKCTGSFQGVKRLWRGVDH